MNACAELVITDLQPFYIAESPRLRNLLEVATGGPIKMPTRYYVRQWVEEIEKLAKASLKKLLVGARPPLTTDIWTSRAGVRFC